MIMALSTAHLPVLRRVVLHEVAIGHRDVANLLEAQHLKHIALSASDTITDAVVESLSARATRLQLRLDSLLISEAPVISPAAVGCALRACVAHTIKFTRCVALRCVDVPHVEPRPELQHLALSSNRNLTYVDVSAVDARRLNVSQCTALQDLRVDTVALDALNMSNCHRLLRVNTGERTPKFDNLRSLNCFCVRSGDSEQLQSLFSYANCAYALLQFLDVSGSSVHELLLRNYVSLEHVSCSGCPSLVHLAISGCWKLKKLFCCGKRMPLSNVQLTLPPNCVVEGTRAEWQYNNMPYQKTIQYTSQDE